MSNLIISTKRVYGQASWFYK